MDLVVDISTDAIRMRRSTGAQVVGPGVPPQLPGGRNGLQRIVMAVQQTAALFDPPVTPRLVVVGTPPVAAPGSQDADAERARMLHELWPDSLLAVCDGGVLAHAATCGGLGVAAHLDVGSQVMGLDEFGTLHRVDGWWPLLGDRGSALDLGRKGLAAACEATDGVGRETLLVEYADEWLDGIDLEASLRLMADPRVVETVAGFAERVCAAAERDDAVAAQLVAEAAIRAGQSCASAAERCQQRMVAVSGRLTTFRVYMTALELALQRFELELVKARHDVLEVPAEWFFADPYQRSCRIVGATAASQTSEQPAVLVPPPKARLRQ